MIVLDASILIRAILGRRVRYLLETSAVRGVQFLAPDVAFEEARKYLPALLRKHGKVDPEISAGFEYLQSLVEPIERELYVPFESDARERLRGRDQNDWLVLATALAFACAVWTEDADFFGTGVAVWTTNRIDIFLAAQVDSPEVEPDE